MLLVDDDEEDLELLREVIRASTVKHRIETAHDGEEALQRLYELQQREELPCLIVLDAKMPKLNGRETLDKMRTEDRIKLIPVIIFSTAAKENEGGKWDLPGVEYLEKPYEYKEFYDIVNKFLESCSTGLETLKDHGVGVAK